MKLFGWFARRQDGYTKDRQRWRAAWAAAMAAEDVSQASALRTQLEALKLPAGDDLEVELEMLDALGRIETLQEHTSRGTLPAVETHHRVVAGEACHFTAPATLPEDPSQASGRLLFSTTRSIFVGGGRPQPIAWHSVRDVVHRERDVVFVRADGASVGHFRFNTFADAAEAAYLARRLKGARGNRGL